MWFDLSYGRTKSGKLWHALDQKDQAICSKKRNIDMIVKLNVRYCCICPRCDTTTKDLWDVPICTNIFAESIDLTSLTNFPKVISNIINKYYNSWTWDESKKMFIDEHNHPCQCGGCFQKYKEDYSGCPHPECQKRDISWVNNYKKTINDHCLYCWCQECVCPMRKNKKMYKTYFREFNPEYANCNCHICDSEFTN